MFSKLRRLLFLFLLTSPGFADAAGAGRQVLKTDERMAGGTGSTVNLTQDAFSLPASNITKRHRIDFAVGRSIFRQNWVTSPSSVKSLQGLGPLFNSKSCVACHVNDGKGAPPPSKNDEMTNPLFRLSLPGKGIHGEPVPLPHYGDQLNTQAIMNVVVEGGVTILFTEEKDSYPDGEKYSLMKPTYTFENLAYGPLPENFLFSPRVAPAIIGLGLLEAIEEKDILKLADAEDRDGDGISGRPNYVWDFTRSKKVVGRFGLKANQPTVFQQNAAALIGDIGITSALFKKQGCTTIQTACAEAHASRAPEISNDDLESLTVYAKTLSVPQKRPLDASEVIRGKNTFERLACARCHVPHFKTGVDPKFPENSRQNIFPYTDLLLHDMGEALADHRPDFEATGTEWRTPPLWGIGMVSAVNRHTRFLHDGRARSIEEAILWHGGEAAASQTKFKKLDKKDRTRFIQFLESL